MTRAKKCEEMEKKSHKPQQFCFDCLQTKIESDFSNKLIFSYGLSDSSPFPFGSSAIVQMSDSDGTGSGLRSGSGSRFVLVQLPTHSYPCLTNYVNEYIERNIGEAGDDGESGISSSEVNQESFGKSSGATIPESLKEKSLCTMDGDGKPSVNPMASASSPCNHSSRYSCDRTITAVAPLTYISTCSYSAFEELANSFLSGSLEDHVLGSLCLLLEGKASGRESLNLLSLIGVPTYDESIIPGSLRHPNIEPVLGLLKTDEYLNLVLPESACTLESILHYSPSALKSEWHLKFLAYQVLSALAYLHGLGVSHGNICPSNVMLTKSCWSWLRVCERPLLGFSSCSKTLGSGDTSFSRLNCCMDPCSSQGLYSDLKLFPYTDWHSQFVQWWKGELSNFEYLLVLNRLAGRRWGEPTFHTVMPWVIDFSTKPDENSDSGWRDLSKSKWRLAKGDEQLDFTYSTSEIPHHVSDECLSELAVCSYKARRLPLNVLRLAVRSVYEPNEYPSNMQRLYQWTPDECIPEFYCDPRIFYSLNTGMTDLGVPSWAGSPEEFIKIHRDALESDRVSRQINNWIDITFGYKMSGPAAVAAKNVMLPSSEPMLPRCVGRRQLFTSPHPVRMVCARKDDKSISCSKMQVDKTSSEMHLLSEAVYLQQMEEAYAFCEQAGELSPFYCYHPEKLPEDMCSKSSDKKLPQESIERTKNGPLANGIHSESPSISSDYLLECIEVKNEGTSGYQDLLLWRHKLACSGGHTEDAAVDIFSIGCFLAELHLKRPLFNKTSLAAYTESGEMPGLLQELPPHARTVVEACIEKNWTMRPSARSILESPYFPATVKSAYLYVAPFQLLANEGSRLHYAATFAQLGVLKAMGTFAAEMCITYCLPLLANPKSDGDAECAYTILKEFIKCLKPKAVKALVLPAVQKILQSTGYSRLKVCLLQGSFMQEIWNLIGKQAYLEAIHPLVISNLYLTPHKSSASAASVLLIGTSEELGVPITVCQTVLPLIHCFGKGLCADGIDVLVRIGGLFGETFIIRQMLPLLKQVVYSCVNVASQSKLEPVQSWSALSLIDCLTTLSGLIVFLPKEMVVKELIEDKCLHVMILMQSNLEAAVLQVAAKSLLAVCQQIGPELTAVHVLPLLKELFNELAFSQEYIRGSGSLGRSSRVSKLKEDGEVQIESRLDLVLLLYRSFASLLGIEKLRQCCATWLLLEQFLLRYHNWKCEYSGESSRAGPENIAGKKPAFSKAPSWPGFNKATTSVDTPAKLLLNGVGWSIPQSQAVRGAKNLVPQKQSNHNQATVNSNSASNSLKREPWFWFPSPAASWDGPDFLARIGSLKDELPWRIRASVMYSIRAHQGSLRSLAVSQDECTVFTAGIGPGFKVTVQKWELPRLSCVSGYYGHEEVVNDVTVLSNDRIASCDGTVHVWNSRTGKVVSVFSEPSIDSAHQTSSSSSVSKISSEHPNVLNSSTLSGGLLNSAFDGSLYTCLHNLESLNMLVVGTGDGSLRFVDVARDQKLHLWRSGIGGSAFSSLTSAICSCGSDKSLSNGVIANPSWIAAGFSSGHCSLFDMRGGNVIASWKAHDGYMTKLAAPEDYLLVSSSLDKTLRIWDLRRNLPSQPIVLKGHTDGVSGFSVWGQDVISISRNKIGLSSLSASGEEDGQHQIIPQKLYTGENGSKNMSVLSSIGILPFSRLFVVGTEDGYLRICC